MKLRDPRPDRNHSLEPSHRQGAVAQRRGVPGKRTLTMGLPSPRSASPAQRRAQDGASPGRTRTGPVEDWMRVAMRPDLYDTPVQRASADEVGYAGAGPTGASTATAGTRMPAAVQAKMEHAFGADFSAVRIHEGPQAPALGALAYAQGTDIHFAPGQYDPGSQRGQEILGHELTHVVQQAEGRVQATGQAKGVGLNDDDGLEREADEMGARAARGEVVSATGAPRAGQGAGQSSGPIQRMSFKRLQQSFVGSLLWSPPAMNKVEKQLLEREQQVRQRLDTLTTRVGNEGEHAEAVDGLEQRLSNIEGATITEDQYQTTLETLKSLGDEIDSIRNELDETEKRLERERQKTDLKKQVDGYSGRLTEMERLVNQYGQYELDEEREGPVKELGTRTSRVREVHGRMPESSQDDWLEKAKGFKSSFETNGGGLETVLGSAQRAVQPYEEGLEQERSRTVRLERDLEALVRSATRKSATFEQARTRFKDKYDQVRGDKAGYQDGEVLAEALYQLIRPVSKAEDQALEALDAMVELHSKVLAGKGGVSSSVKTSEIRRYNEGLAQALNACRRQDDLIEDACTQLAELEREYQTLCKKHRRIKGKGSGEREDTVSNDDGTGGSTRTSGPLEHDGRRWHPFGPNLYGCIILGGNSGLSGPGLALFQDALQFQCLISPTSTGESGVKLKNSTYEIKVRRTNLTAYGLESDLRIYGTDNQTHEHEGRTVRLITFGAVDNGH
jgi:hypothetical protein